MAKSDTYFEHYSWMSELLTSQKKTLFEEKIIKRTQHIIPIFENPEKSHNLSAILRSTEAFGFQKAGTISYETPEIDKATSKSSEKWLNFFEWDHPEAMVKDLKQKGYRILVTDLNPNSKSIDEFDWSVPTAICLGNERKGVSNDLRSLADGSLHLPLSGFTESLNVSVTWGILAALLSKMKFPQMEENLRYKTLLEWTIRSLPEGEAIYLNACKERGLRPFTLKERHERSYRRTR